MPNEQSGAGERKQPSSLSHAHPKLLHTAPNNASN
jgi:hypothetical protein